MAKGDNNQQAMNGQMGHTGFMPMNNQVGNGGMVPNMMPSNNPSQMQSMMPSPMLMHAIGQHMMSMNGGGQPGGVANPQMGNGSTIGSGTLFSATGGQPNLARPLGQ